MSATVTIDRQGSRVYFRGAPFAANQILKAGGAHWDAERKAWWVGVAKLADAEAMAAEIAALPAEEPRQRAERVLISGNTYPVKDRLRQLGGFWSKEQGGWMVPADKADEARKIVAGAGPAQQRGEAGQGPRFSPRPRRGWAPCGYPGCSPDYCDECDGEGRYGRGGY